MAALAGGADVIDVKEPSRGSLGAASTDTIEAVVRAVAGRAPVTAAFGELTELLPFPDDRVRRLAPRGIALFKIGLSGCGSNWPERWRKTVARIEGNARPVAVAYADWQSANSPPPDEVLAALAAECPALLVDTWNKVSGSLFDHWPLADLEQFVDRVKRANLALVLAGSLSGANLEAAVRLQPALVAVRGAACEAGRESRVTRERVAALQRTIRLEAKNLG